MSAFSNCIYDSALIAAAIESCNATETDIASGLSDSDHDIQAVAALCAGIHSLNACAPALSKCLNGDTLSARCATWALGQLNSEALLLSLLENGNIDQRENAYHALSILAARGQHSEQLNNAMQIALDQEMQRIANGKSGLGEKACRVLATLGDTATLDALQRVMSADQYCDRFEIQRLRKCMENDGRDTETIEALSQPWQQQFADDLGEAPVHEDNTTLNEELASNTGDDAENAPNLEPEADSASKDMPEFDPIDWEGFLASDEAAALDEQGKAITAQMGPMFEQLSVRALGKPLVELVAQEFTALVLQILPQAIPPEYMQAALSPPALNGMKALAQFLKSSGVTNDEGEHNELEDAVRTIRETIQQQIRASGSLHGSDYDEET